MPSYVNIGARVGKNTMVDTWATVGSCAQIGDNVHLSGGVGIGGVLEPPQAVAGDGRRRLPDRQPLHRGRRRPRRRRRRARRRRASSPPRSRSSTPRPARRSAGARCRRGASPCSATRPREFPGGEFGLPCVLVIKRLEPRASATTSRSSTTSSATTAPPPDGPGGRPRWPPTCSRSRRSSSTSRRRAATSRSSWRGSRPTCAAVPVARARPGSATTSSPAPTSAAPQRLILAGHTDTVPGQRQRPGRGSRRPPLRARRRPT